MATLDFLETREQFLPVQQATILKRASGDSRLSPREREQLATLFEIIQARFHFEFHDEIERLRIAYDPFDPDRDTLPLAELSAAQREAAFGELVDGFRKLLVDGNYVELTHEQLNECLQLQTFGGLSVRVDLDDYDELQIFYRGVRREQRTRRSAATLWRKRTRDVRVLKRVALLVRAAETRGDVVRIKLFKDVVVDDLKMVAPEVRVRMRLLDKLKVGSTVAGGMTPPVLKLVAAVAISPALLIALVGGCIGACFKGVFSFLSSKTKYMQTLSASLYYQNLANNFSALTRLVDAAEAEEAKELLLAYFMLYTGRERDYTLKELDRCVEAWLGEQFALNVDFEVDDAVRKLIEKGLMVEREVPGGSRRVLKVFDLPSSLRKLDEAWDNYFTWNNENGDGEDRLADGQWPSGDSAACCRGS